jgi:Ca-activated chloride channel family protein
MSHAVWIRTTSLLATLGWLATGCGTSSASAGTPSKAPLAAASTGAAAPHVFTPRPHPPRVRELPPAPNLASLPAMIDRTRTCFGVAEEDGGWAQPPSTPTRNGHSKKRKAKRSSPPGFVPYGKGGGGSSPKKDAEPRRPKAKAAGASKSSAEFGGVLGGSSGAADDARPSSAPPALPTPVQPSPAVGGSDKELARDRPLGPVASEQTPAIATDADDGYHDWGAAIYLSNDDTMSLSSAQRVIFAIDNFLPLPAEHIRPHELLNYFSFDTAPVGQTDDFSVDASIAPDPDQEGIYSLAMAVRGRPLALEERRNANLSIVVDRSGSMSAEGRMTYLKRGLEQMTGQLKTGDMVHLVLFDHEVCTALENFVVGRDRPAVLMDAVRSLEPRGSTDLHLGLNAGYQLADRTYQPTYGNRVVMITDAIANTGITDEQLIATVGKFYDERRIRLSGVGVGRDFNDGLLDQLTERGKGAYVFLGSEAEVDAVFGPRFISLVETTALDVHFQLHLPPSLRMNVFYGEESSTVKEEVQAIHYFANTSQLFLSDLMARDGQLRGQDSVMLTVEYEDPESGDEMLEEYAFTLDEIREQSRNVRKGRLVMRFVDGLAWMASRPTPGGWGSRGQSWEDGEAWEACEAGRGELAELAKGLEEDPEVRRVTGLWDQYCARYTQPREPVRRPPPSEGWPSATGR